MGRSVLASTSAVLLTIVVATTIVLYAQPSPAPGGVTGASLWVKADLGLSANASNQVQEWLDQSGSGNTTTQLRAAAPQHTDAIAPSNDILRVANGINFNPTVDFSGASGKSLKGNAATQWDVTPITIFGVALPEGAPGGGAGGIFDGLSNWTGADATAAGVGLAWNGTSYVLDGSGCGTASTISPVAGPRVLRGIYTSGTNQNGGSVWLDGVQEDTGTSCATNATTLFEVGGRTAGSATFDNRIFNGKIAEVIVFRSAVTAADSDRIESYLAIKYGITLRQTPTAKNYADSGSVVIWDATANAAYNQNIAGIGRDDASGLVQRQSKSINAGEVVTIGLGTIAADNQANPNNFLTDRSFLIWGRNGGAPTLLVPVMGTPLVRLQSVWKVQETGEVGDVVVRIPAILLPGPSPVLLRSDNDTFDSSDTQVALVLNGANYETPTAIDVDDAHFFTFGSDPLAPGGVVGATYWIRPEEMVASGTTLTNWDDVYGAHTTEVIAATVVREPSTFNFHPTANFSPGYMAFVGQQLLSGATAGEQFTMLQSLGTHATADGYPSEFGGGGSGQTWQYDWSDSNVYSGWGSTVRKIWNPLLAPAGGPARDVLQPHIYNVLSQSGEWTARFDGLSNFTTATNTVQFNSSPSTNTYIGASHNSVFNGRIAEVIVYGRELTTAERQRVNSYVAVKYGVTLGTTTSPIDYLTSSGTVVWSSSTIYQNDVAGIGRDDSSGLNQKQSRSLNTENSGNLVTIGLGAIAADNAANVNTFGADRTFMIWGDDAGAPFLSTPMSGLVPGTKRLTRVWKVQETGTVGTVLVRVPLAALAGSNQVLIRSIDATFDATDTIVPLTADASGYEAPFDFADGDFFTFAAVTIAAPGGVSGGLGLWLKADLGATVDGSGNFVNGSGWVDQSGSGRDANLIFSDPQRVVGTVNFNPTVRFDGNDYMRFSASPFANAFTAGEVFTVTKENAAVAAGNGGPYDFGGGSNSHYTWSNGAIYNEFGTSVRFAWNPTTKSIVENKGGAIATVNGPSVDPSLFHIYATRSAPGIWAVGFDGFDVASTASHTVSFVMAAGNEHIGATSGAIFNGEVPEVFLYNRSLTATERQWVNSYLAIKYGVTLTDAGGAAQNYANSADATIWTGVANPAYHNAVAGIVTDGASALDQRVSQSIIAGDQIAIASGAFDFSGTITAQSPPATIGDGSSLVWGHNNGSNVVNILVTDPNAHAAGIDARMARIWRDQITGTGLPGQLSIRIPATLIEIANPSLRTPALLISPDPTFATGTRVVPLAATAGFYTATFATFGATEQYFTIAGATSFVTMTKAFAPTTVAIGGTTRLVFTLTTSSPALVSGFAFTDTLPSGLIVAPMANATTSCGAGTVNASGSVISLSGGAVTAFGTCTVEVSVTTAPAITSPLPCPAPSLTNSASNVTGLSPNLELASGFGACVSAVLSADLSIVKTAPVTFDAGATVAYTLTASNHGPSTAQAVTITDVLPAQLAFVSSPNCSAAGQSVTCNVGTLTSGQVAPVTLNVQVLPTLPVGTVVDNTASVSSTTPDPNSANNASSVASPVTGRADVQIVKSVSGATVAPGDTYAYTLTVTNNGPSSAANVNVTDTLPTQATFVSSAAGCTAVGQSMSCPAIASLAVGATQSFDLVVRLDPSYVGDGSDVLNVALALAQTSDPFLANNSSRFGAAPVGGPNADLAIVKDVSTDPVTSGTPFFYRLTVANQGPSTAANVVVTDPLPVGVSFVSSPDGCTAAGQVVTCPATASLVPGQAATFVLVVQLDPSYVGNGSDIQNVASVSSTATDPVLSNNTSNPATPVIGTPEADVAIAKAVVEPSVAPGGIFTYRLVVTNAGPSTALGVVVTDPLPSPVTFVSSPQGCAAAGQLVTCPPLGSMAVGTSVTYDIRVRLEPLYPGDGSDIVNIATSTSSTRDSVPSNGTSAPVTLSVILTGVDIGVALAASPVTTVIGDLVTFSTSVTNLGPDAATGLTVSLPLPELEMRFDGVTASAGGYDPGTGVWTIGHLPIGGKATMQLQARVVARGLPVVTASVSHVDQIPRNPANDTASVTLNLTGWSISSADLVIDGTTTPVVAPGAVAAFELTAVNRGPAYVIDLVITGDVPLGTTFAGVAPSGGGACTTPAMGAGGTVTCKWPGVTDMGAGTKRTMTLGVRVDAGAAPATSLTSSFTVTSLSTEYYQPSNRVTLTTSVADGGGAADLALTAIMQSEGRVGTALALTLGAPTPLRFTVRNNGPMPISNARYVIEVPDLGYLQILGAAFSQGVVELTGLSAAEWQVGPLPVGASATFDLNVAMQSMRATTITMRRVTSAPADLSSANDRATLILDGTGHPLGGERHTAIGTVDGVGTKEVLTGAGRLETPQVRIYNGNGDAGLHFYAYSREFVGGVRLASCDVDADGVDEIITGPGIGPGPHVRVLRLQDEVIRELVGFYAFDPSFAGGVNLACADVDNDGRAEVITAMGQDGSQVKVWGVGKDLVVEKASFTAYESGFVGGVRLAAIDTTEAGGSQYQIITVPGPGRPLEARAWAVSGGTATLVKALSLTGPEYQLGAFIDVADLNSDGLAEAVLATDVGMPALVGIVTIDSTQIHGTFQAYPSSFLGGARVSLGDVDNNGQMELLISPGQGGRPIVDVYTLTGSMANVVFRLNPIEIP